MKRTFTKPSHLSRAIIKNKFQTTFLADIFKKSTNPTIIHNFINNTSYKLFHTNLNSLILDDKFQNRLNFKHLQQQHSNNLIIQKNITINMPILNNKNQTITNLVSEPFYLFLNQFYQPIFNNENICDLQNFTILPFQAIKEINFVNNLQNNLGKSACIEMLIDREILQKNIKNLLLEENVLQNLLQNLQNELEEEIDISQIKINLQKLLQKLENNNKKFEILFFSTLDTSPLKKAIKQLYNNINKNTNKSLNLNENNIYLQYSLQNNENTLQNNEINLIINNTKRDAIWSTINQIFLLEEFDGQGHVSKYFENENKINKIEIEEIRSIIFSLMKSYNNEVLREDVNLNLIEVYHSLIYSRGIYLDWKEEDDCKRAKEFYWWAQEIATRNVI